MILKMMVLLTPCPPTPGQGLSPADILHLDEEEANLMNTYTRIYLC